MDVVEKGDFESWLIPETPEDTKLMLSRLMNVDDKQLERGSRLIQGLTHLRGERNETYRRVWRLFEPEIEKSAATVAAWNRIECPAQVIWGLDDRIVDASGANVLVDTLPDCRLDSMNAHGHAVNKECPEELAQLVVEFRDCQKKKKSSISKCAN